jgi:diaminohydroxyphosphoribosylaminopyrimidine deaminase/5-amino-6-(5-phosphoribosylamino)uracil reductase
MSTDSRMMRRALELARLGRGRVEPNPMVGAVLVRHDAVVGEGHHERFGGPHAEVNAIAQAGARAEGATLYVTLEPCCHRGKTPPCTRAIIAAGITRVVVAMEDPFERVGGAGIAELKAAGIEVAVGVLEAEARALNAPYLTLRTVGRPFFTAKWAMTLDGKTATRTGDSHWVSSEVSRQYVHELRNVSDAVLVGIGTVLADDPVLTCRISNGRSPRRIVVDSFARTPTDSRLIETRSEAPVIIAASDLAEAERVQALRETGCTVLVLPDRAGHVDLKRLARELGRMEMTNVLCESGSTLTAALLAERLIDRVAVFLAGKLVGGRDAPGAVGGSGLERMDQALPLDDLDVRRLGQDILVEATVRYPQDATG